MKMHPFGSQYTTGPIDWSQVSKGVRDCWDKPGGICDWDGLHWPLERPTQPPESDTEVIDLGKMTVTATQPSGGVPWWLLAAGAALLLS